jgi:hypothetical protein
MLNKLQVALLVGAVLTVLRVFFPTVELPEGMSETIADLIWMVFTLASMDLIWMVFTLASMGGAAWKVKESRAKVEALTLKD